MTSGLVTVGTTPFEGLVQLLDQPSETIRLTFQIGGGTYIPRHHEYFRFSVGFAERLRSVDFVVTHAGAGSVYNCLELGLPTLIVPNLEREDPHQAELAAYIRDSGFAEVVQLTDLIGQPLDSIVSGLLQAVRQPYKKDRFFVAKEIVDFLRS